MSTEQSKPIKKTWSRCPACGVSVVASVVHEDGVIALLKTCPRHGEFRVVLASDPRFYYTSIGKGSCCTDNDGCSSFDELSTCIALIEIVDSCNLSCPTCYAGSPVGVGDEVDALPFSDFASRVGRVLEKKGAIDILQLTGGEPTLHPEFFKLLEWALDQDGVGYILINTNGVRIAGDEEFRERLARLRRSRGRFELYLQFDGPQSKGQSFLRGEDLRDVRTKALDEAGSSGIPSTLAMVVTRETLPFLGDTVRFGLAREHCRGVTFQPEFRSGRVSNTLPPPAQMTPITVGDVVNHVVRQSEGVLCQEDFTPLPCGDPNCHTLGYLIRHPAGTFGLSRVVDLKALQGFLSQRVNYDLSDLSQCGCETEPLGKLLAETEIKSDQPFRIFIKPFMDRWTYDQDRIDRCCTHVIRPDGQLDSFCHYYLDPQEKSQGAESSCSS